MIDIPDSLFKFAVKQKQLIINLFWFGYIVLLILTVLGQIFLESGNPLYLKFPFYAEWAGKIAIIFLLLTGIPGILRRFKINLRASSLLMLFRRQLGLTVYFLVLFHYMILRFDKDTFFNPHFLLFEWFGFIAFNCLIIMAITSNEYSVRKLGKWWTRIHMLFYIIVWLVFFHVFLQERGIWALLIGFLGVMEIVSYIYYFTHRIEPQQKVV